MTVKLYTDLARPPSPGVKTIAVHVAALTNKSIPCAGQCSRESALDLAPAALAVLRVAAEIEPEQGTRLEWYRHTPIAEFGELTAEKLVAMDRAGSVIAFLRSIRDGKRD